MRYLEQNFSVLPQEFYGRSLAFNLLRTIRSLRRYAGYRRCGKGRARPREPFPRPRPSHSACRRAFAPEGGSASRHRWYARRVPPRPNCSIVRPRLSANRASTFILSLAGIAPAAGPSVNINIEAKAGHVIDFRSGDPADTKRIVSSTAQPVAIDHDEDGDESPTARATGSPPHSPRGKQQSKNSIGHLRPR